MSPIRKTPRFSAVRNFAVGLALSLAACAPSLDSMGPSGSTGDDGFLECQGKCDTAGSMTISGRWIPVGGSIRVDTGGTALSVSPQEGVEIQERSGGRYIATFSTAGYYSVMSAGGSIPVRVANDGLQIEILSPEPGSFVEAPEGESMTVSGRVSDSLGAPIASLEVDERAVAVDEAGNFQFQRSSKFGINTIAMRALDPAGNEFDIARSFMTAPEFSKEPASTFVQLDNEAMEFIAEAIEPKLAVLLARTMGELEASQDPIGSADGDPVLVNGVSIPGLGGESGSFDVDIVAGSGGRMEAHLSTSGITTIELQTASGLFTHKVDVKVSNLEVIIGMDFSRYRDVGPLVTDLQLVNANGAEGFVVDVRNVADFIEDLFIADNDIKQQFANGIKDALAPELSALFTSFGGTAQIDLAGLGLETQLGIEYGVNNIRAVNGALQVDLFSRLPAVEASAAPGAPRR